MSGGSRAAALVALLLIATMSRGQTPEQQRTWDAERAQRLAAEQAEAQRLAQARAARRADPMSWVRTLDPMTNGGWEFRSVASDGSWATFSTTHQLKRSGSTVTLWLRQEFAEPQPGPEGRYQSLVEKTQYDCRKNTMRDLIVIYYSGNDLQGSQSSDESDAKDTPWNPIVPGTREEMTFLWACGRSG